MILTVLFPTEAPYEFRGRIIVSDALMPLVTRVRAVRRLAKDDRRVEVEAFVPERMRRSIKPLSRFVTSEYARMTANIAENKKSLAAFLDSGEAELLIPEEA